MIVVKSGGEIRGQTGLAPLFSPDVGTPVFLQ
jgi:hypothetical protein